MIDSLIPELEKEHTYKPFGWIIAALLNLFVSSKQ